MEDKTKNLKAGKMTNDAFARMGRLLEATPAQQSEIAPKVLLLSFLFFACINVYFCLWPSPYVNTDYARASLTYDALLIFLTTILFYSKNYFKQNRALLKLMPYVYAAFLAVSLMMVGTRVGHLSFMLGVIATLIPIFAIILFDLMLVIFLLIVGLICFAVIIGMDYYGIIAYAPFFEPTVMDTRAGRIFYAKFALVVGAPFYVCALGAGAALVSYWRKREQEVRQMSMTDSLIPMNNRRAINEYLVNAINHGGLEHKPTSIIMVDIDHFKVVNDTFGHHIGDAVLCEVGNRLKRTIGDLGQVGRYGGEEFLIVLDNMSAERAIEIAHTGRQAVLAAQVVDNQENTVSVSASFGVYTAVLSQNSAEVMLRKVDEQLYRAKEQGRNCVCY